MPTGYTPANYLSIHIYIQGPILELTVIKIKVLYQKRSEITFNLAENSPAIEVISILEGVMKQSGVDTGERCSLEDSGEMKQMEGGSRRAGATLIGRQRRGVGVVLGSKGQFGTQWVPP